MRTREHGKTSHAKKRFRQRYGRDISSEQLQALVELTGLNKVLSKIVDRDKYRVKIRVGEEVICFIYCPTNRQIITFLNA